MIVETKPDNNGLGTPFDLKYDIEAIEAVVRLRSFVKYNCYFEKLIISIYVQILIRGIVRIECNNLDGRASYIKKRLIAIAGTEEILNKIE